MSEPLVSCLTCTYGRPILLGECIKCFLDQNYRNKELIIVNDQEGVNLRLHPSLTNNIKIYNHPQRFKSLGQKRNYLKSLGHGDYYFIWDDDDLFMPYRISESIRLMQETKFDIIKPQYALMSTNNKDYKLVQNLFHSHGCITREYMQKTSYPDKSVGEDVDFESKAKVGSFDVRPWYVYRWGQNIHHLSGIANNRDSWDRSLTFEPYTKIKGEVLVGAEFQKDYWKDISELLDRSKYKKS